MATVIRMPAALAGATEGAIQSWLTEVGREVSVGDPLAEIETEKAVVEYAAEVAGTVGRLIAEPGRQVEVGQPIAVILAPGETDADLDDALGGGAAAPTSASQPSQGGEAAGVDDAAEPAQPAAPGAPEPTVTPAPAPPEPETSPPDEAEPVPSPLTRPAPEEQQEPMRSGDRTFASPIVRRLARERGLDLGSIHGSGPGGRIVRRDVDGIQSAPEPEQPAATGPAPAPAPRKTAGAIGTPEKLTGMRRAIARRLTESKTTVPHFYITAHCRADQLMALRAHVNEAAPRKISVNDFVLKAVAGALVDVPAANAIWGGDHILRYDGVDIAVAVAIEGGLLTPVIRGADRLSLVEVSAAAADLASRARAGNLQQHELEGGSFSVSNLGMYGVDEFSAILNPPQSGILAVSAAKQQPVVEDGALAVGTMMTVTLSADHRVVDGAVGAEWMAAFVRRIENPVSALL